MNTKYIKENANDTVFNLEYNSERQHLIIPEYGRHLQKLIDQATDIEDVEKRNKVAKYIIQVMGSLNPHLRDVPDFQHKLWDQLFIMSDFRLVVDSPYPIPSREVLQLKPDVLQYPQNFPKYRFYGNNIKYMIESYLSWNKDTVKDDVIFEHLYELSGGKINMTESAEELLNTNDLLRTNKRISNKIMPAGVPKIAPNKSKTTKTPVHKNQNRKV
jgi:Domain of unknown function (DUF4290)